MTERSPEFQRVGSGCGVQGCLFTAVAIFVLLLVGVLVVAFFRFQEPPQGIPRPPQGLLAPAVDSPLLALDSPSCPTADDRRPTDGVEATEGGIHA